MRCTMLLLGLAAAMAGCVTDGADSRDDGDGDGGKSDGATTMAGSYALELLSNMKLEDDRKSGDARFSQFSLRARALVTARQTGKDVALSIKLCDAKLPMVDGFQPALDPALIPAIPAVALTGVLADGRLSTESAAIVLGAALSDPIGEALPTTDTDARLRDQDRDDKPGVTIAISVGRIFAALRVRFALDAPVSSTSTIAGAADLHLDQAILGDTIPFFDAAASAAESNGHIRVVSAANTFRMKSNAATCAEVSLALP
jgi:hypothetical protein